MFFLPLEIQNMELKHNYSYRHSHVVSSVSCAFYVYHLPIIFVMLINLSLISLEKTDLNIIQATIMFSLKINLAIQISRIAA